MPEKIAPQGRITIESSDDLRKELLRALRAKPVRRSRRRFLHRHFRLGDAGGGFTGRPQARHEAYPDRHPRPASIPASDQSFDKIFRNIDPRLLPLGESLYDCERRVLPFWNDSILPHIRKGATVLVALSGNSGRAIVKGVDRISDEAIAELNIPTGQPMVYEFDEDSSPLKHYYLATDEEIAAQIESVKFQGKPR